VAYEKTAGTVRWYVDGSEVDRVDKLGRVAERQYLMLYHGGVEMEVSPTQLAAGMSMFTLLDGSRANRGLVHTNPFDDRAVRDVLNRAQFDLTIAMYGRLRRLAEIMSGRETIKGSGRR
jgi:hypothetical protein